MEPAATPPPSRLGRLARGVARFLRWGDGAVFVLAAILVAGGFVAAYKVSLVRGLRYAGHADEAAYAMMGRGLAEGRGLQVDYVSFFFRPYPRGITRTEDHWPPFLGFASAPFIRWHGPEAWAAKLAPILIGSIGFPLAAAALGLALSRRGLVALACGALVLFHPYLFNESLRMMSDISSAMWVTAFAAALLAARARPWLHVVAGVSAAMAFYAKGSHLMLFPLWPALAALVGGPRSLLRRWWWIGLGVGLLGVAPFLWSKWREYGNPLHCTQNHVSGYIGLLPWESGTYTPYWGEGLPRVSDRWTRYREAWKREVADNMDALTRFAFFRRPHKRGPDPWQAPVGTAAIAFAAFAVGVAPVAALWRWACRRKGYEETPRARALALPGTARALLALALLGAAQWAFVVYLWEGYDRLAFPLLAIVMAAGCSGLAWAGELPLALALPRAWPRWRWVLVGGVACAAVGWGIAHRSALVRQHAASVARAGYPYRDQDFYPRLGDWLNAHLPRAVIMTRNPWELLFACRTGIKAVNIPLAEPGRVLAIARYYGVTHYLSDGRRPAMARVLGGRHPAFVRVPSAPGELYEIRWEALLPTETTQPPPPEPPDGAGA